MRMGSPGRVCGCLGTFPRVFLKSLNSDAFPSSPSIPRTAAKLEQNEFILKWDWKHFQRTHEVLAIPISGTSLSTSA